MRRLLCPINAICSERNSLEHFKPNVLILLLKQAFNVTDNSQTKYDLISRISLCVYPLRLFQICVHSGTMKG